MRNSVSKRPISATDEQQNTIQKKPKQRSQISLYGPQGRLYLNASERQAFEEKARLQNTCNRALCLILLYTGCRLSEALALHPSHIQLKEGVISIQSLKKRGGFHVREVPVPQSVLALLPETNCGKRFFPMGRTTAWRMISNVMTEAGISGPQAMPKGLRHGFGCNAVMCGIPLNILQRWLGHSDIRTTAIYASITGPEERLLAERMWP